ncbi:MAG: hypothetical protein LBQ62_03150, partial [Candidatus Accumulibacter sp.]|nr:hypothetical protein [Accumulibacter sp.]
MNAIVALCAFSAKRQWGYALLLGALALSALLLRPVDALVIRFAPSDAGDDAPLFVAGAPLGQEFATQYVHSVQLTPVQ